MRRAVLVLVLIGCNETRIASVTEPPVARIITPGPGSTLIAGEIQLLGQVADGQDPPERLWTVWRAGDGNTWRELCSPGVAREDGTAPCTDQLRGADTLVQLEVTDRAGWQAQDQVEVRVLERSPPVAEILAPLPPGPYYADLPVLLDGVVTDADEGETVSVSWSSSLDGTVAVGQVAEVLLSEGEHELVLRGEDELGLIGTAASRIAVRGPNAAPECRFEPSLHGMAVAPGTELQVGMVALDAETPVEALAMALDAGGSALLYQGPPGPDGTLTVPWTPTAVGTTVLTLVVEDDARAACEATDVITVDLPPEVVVVAPTEGHHAAHGASVTLTATAADATSPPAELWVGWSSDRDGPLGGSAPDADGRATIAVPGLSVGVHLLTATAVDPLGLDSSASVSIEVDQ